MLTRRGVAFLGMVPKRMSTMCEEGKTMADEKKEREKPKQKRKGGRKKKEKEPPQAQQGPAKP